METKTKSFDAVEMSRHLREDTSRKLNAMTRENRLAYLRQVRERYAAEWAASNPEKVFAI
jgi:hypothetical protein